MHFFIFFIFIVFLLTVLFIKPFWYKESVVSLVLKYCKCSIYAFVSKLTILIFKAHGLVSTGAAYELSYSGRGLAQVRDKAQRGERGSKVWRHHTKSAKGSYYSYSRIWLLTHFSPVSHFYTP